MNKFPQKSKIKIMFNKNELFYKGNFLLKRGVHMHLWHPLATALHYRRSEHIFRNKLMYSNFNIYTCIYFIARRLKCVFKNFLTYLNILDKSLLSLAVL